jgi:member of the syntaxin family of t-SNAREs
VRIGLTHLRCRQLTFPRDVLQLLNTTRPLFASYLRIRSSASSATSPELVDARNELESTLQDLSADLRDLVESVKAVEHDPYRYGLDTAEVSRRRRLVEEVGAEVENMGVELRTTVQEARTGKASVNGDVLPHPDDFGEEDEDGYAQFEQERQMEMMAEQDEQLDDVFRTVGNLRRQADDMGRELEEQGEMLQEVDTVADRVGGKIQDGIKRVGWVIRKNEGGYAPRGTDREADGSRSHVKLLHCGAHIRFDTTADPGPCPLMLR